MITLKVPFDNVAYETKTHQCSTQGLQKAVLDWLEKHHEGHNRKCWGLSYHPKQIRLYFKDPQTAMLFKLIYGGK